MAHIETWWRCICGAAFSTQKEAISCAIRHVTAEKWAVGKGGKRVRIFDNWASDSCHGINGAMIEADNEAENAERRKECLET